jgi:hypothetical protein
VPLHRNQTFSFVTTIIIKKTCVTGDNPIFRNSFCLAWGLTCFEHPPWTATVFYPGRYKLTWTAAQYALHIVALARPQAPRNIQTLKTRHPYSMMSHTESRSWIRKGSELILSPTPSEHSWICKMSQHPIIYGELQLPLTSSLFLI